MHKNCFFGRRFTETFLNSSKGKQIIGSLINLSMNAIELKHTPHSSWVWLLSSVAPQAEIIPRIDFWQIKRLAKLLENYSTVSHSIYKD